MWFQNLLKLDLKIHLLSDQVVPLKIIFFHVRRFKKYGIIFESNELFGVSIMSINYSINIHQPCAQFSYNLINMNAVSRIINHVSKEHALPL